MLVEVGPEVGDDGGHGRQHAFQDHGRIAGSEERGSGLLRRAGEHEHTSLMAREIGASQDLRADEALAVTDQVGDRELRAQVQVCRDMPARRRQVDQGDLVRLASGDREREVDAHGGRPDAAFRGVHDDQPSSRPPGRCDQRAGPELPGAPVAKVERLDPGIELRVVDGPDHHVVGARFEEADPLLDLVGRADREDGHLGEGGDGPDLTADVGKGTRRGDDVEDDHVHVDGGCRDLLRVVDARQGSAGAAEDLGERVAGGIAEQQDSSVGHGSPWWSSGIGAARGYNRLSGLPVTAVVDSAPLTFLLRATPSPAGQPHRKENRRPCVATSSCWCSGRTRRTTGSPRSSIAPPARSSPPAARS
jgi:hypothetical protein